MDIESNKDYHDTHYENNKFPKIVIDTNFYGCSFTNIDFSSCDLKEVYFENCKFISCDFSLCTPSRYALKYDEFISCKLMGISFIEDHIEGCLFKETNMKYANFSDSKLDKVVFDDVNLEESSFISLKKLNKVVFNKCNLRLGDFYNTSLNGVDLTSCDITGIKTDLDSLKGLIVTPMQALDLSTILGIVIKD